MKTAPLAALLFNVLLMAAAALALQTACTSCPTGFVCLGGACMETPEHANATTVPVSLSTSALPATSATPSASAVPSAKASDSVRSQTTGAAAVALLLFVATALLVL
ncbi:uncharacterized protein BJ171DRAFT_520211 [Polychytrium aggregatum]|uniref:uncharacterized protein n=1 Tax=Polychytrium aggregatum TaxID=110093 RepID=UPI0022FEC3D3|nr:uncharacterized protein BJ171DRAFT_520211 [Polychytrium aggregatum]KAI9197413.1 hypothetical protein BJ171DRAFT_520211 [Polychytrium aggregatum]